MKQYKYFLATVFFACMGITQIQAQIKVGNYGRVGIAMEPNSVTSPFGNFLPTNLSVAKGVDFKITTSGGFKFCLADVSVQTSSSTYMIYSLPALYSDYPNYFGVLGTAGNPFYEIRGRNLYYTSIFQLPSDMRMKTNIKKAPDANDKLSKVNIYQYDVSEKFFNQDEKTGAASASLYKNQTGVMAQELKEIFPELVCYDSINDMYGVNYVGFIPHLIQAVQSQSKEIETLKTELAYYQQNCCNAASVPKKVLQNGGNQATQAQLDNPELVSARLDQNAPNPFKESTRISYFVPEGTTKANIFVYNLNGVQIKHIPVTAKGEGSISINGNELAAGMYLYTLIIDSTPIDTKRMILTE